MIITYDYLIKILTEAHLTETNCNEIRGDDISPKQALYIKFKAIQRGAKDTITYEGVDGSIIAIDLDQQGKVLGIEFL